MVISAGDDDWARRLTAAFAERIQFELCNTDKLNLESGELFKLIAQWSIKWNCTPIVTSPYTISFRPGKLPPEPSRISDEPPPPGEPVSNILRGRV